MRFVGFAVVIATLLPTPSVACEYNGPLVPKISGETSADRERRIQRAYDDDDVIREYERQSADFSGANTVFLGEVTRSSQSEPQPGIQQGNVSVKPIAPFKGTLPATEIELSSQNSTGLCYPQGDGRAPFAQKGDLVIVFSGLKPGPFSYGLTHGIDSMDISRPLAREVVDALAKYGIEQAGE